MLIGAQKPSPKSHHLDEVLLFVNCLGCGFKINLFWGETVIDFVKPSWKRRYRLNWANLFGNSPNPGGGGDCFLQTSPTPKTVNRRAIYCYFSLVSLKGLFNQESFAATKDRPLACWCDMKTAIFNTGRIISGNWRYPITPGSSILLEGERISKNR